jgi:hypothetical protein
MLADERTSDEEFEQPGGLVRGEEGRGVRGGCGVLIGAVLMAITREKSTGGCYSGDRFQKRREGEDCGRREMTRGAHMAAREERAGGVPVRGGVMLGRGWLLELGRMASQVPFTYFFLLYFFSFSIFLFLSQISQKGSKSI